MPAPTSSMIVPPCPKGVAFNREDFLLDKFTIDGFLAKYAGNIGLESLRDELGMYLQVLRVAMIELINDDYADFVNLSSNLVGMDSRIEAIRSPLTEFHSQLDDLHDKLTATRNELKAKLDERNELAARRIALRNLEHIINTLNKVERLLGLHDGEAATGEDVELTGDLVERVASDVNYLNFCISKCEVKSFVDEIKPRIHVIAHRLNTAMESQLLDAIQNNNKDVLKRCLRIYATVDQVEEAENLIRSKVIAPYLESVISYDSLHSDPLGLKGVCQRIMKIIPNKLHLLLELTDGSSKTKKGSSSKMTDFNFIVRSLWPEIVERFEHQLPSMFSAGNPDPFHSNYGVCMEFLKQMTASISSASAREAFEASPHYVTFVGKWNLAVYFQIRFHEIASPVEESCSPNFFAIAEKQQQTEFNLKSTEVMMEAVRKSWDPAIYIQELLPKFWKLTLQIIARYTSAVGEASKEENMKRILAKDQKVSHHGSTLKASETTVGPLNQLSTSSASSSTPFAKSHARSASDTGLGNKEQQDGNVEAEIVVGITEEELVKSLIMTYLDVTSLTNRHLEQIIPEIVSPAVVPSLSEPMEQMFEESIVESKKELLNNLTPLTKVITDSVAKKSMPYLKQVADIPRLYRRTNRELPTKPCAYMTALLSPIVAFHEAYKSTCPREIIHEWLVAIFTKISGQYLSNVTEVLEAVQKMEESLRKLKMVREKTSAKAGLDKAGGQGQGLSDDDKIRLQLYVDVKQYIKVMQDQLGVQVEEILDPQNGDKKTVASLDELVTEATKSCYDDYMDKVKA